MATSKLVTFHILWEEILAHLCLWPTASEWHCTFCERQSDHIFSYDQQVVSDIAHFVKEGLITSFPMTNSQWVTLHILWKAVWSHLFLWPTASEWHCTFCERQSDHIFSYDQQQVSNIVHFMRDSLITSFSMTNSKWVTVKIFLKAVSSHLFLWPPVCEWHCTFCKRQSHHIFSYVQQQVSNVANFVKDCLIASCLITNSLWETPLHILWKAVWSHCFLWPIGCESYCTFCENLQSYHIFSNDPQQVSHIAHFLTYSLSIPQFIIISHVYQKVSIQLQYLSISPLTLLS